MKTKRDIKIGMMSAYFATMKGGGEHYTLHLSNNLTDMGYDITIVCGKQPFKKPEPLSNRFKIDYVPLLYFLREISAKRIKGISLAVGAAYSVHYILSSYVYLLKHAQSFDIIHTHDPASLIAAIKAKEKYGYPVVSTFHGHPSSWNIRHVKHADAVIVVSEGIKSSFERFGIKNTHVVSGGVDLSHFKPFDKKKCKEILELKGKIILFIGRLIPIKNLHNLLYAFKKVKSVINDAKLVIVGDGTLKNDLVHTTQKIGLNENVIFTGALSYEKLSIYYNAADVFVLPSIFESFPLVALEAAACGLPMVISEGAAAFIKEFGEDALFVTQPDDPKKISESLITSLTNEDIVHEKVIIGLKMIQSYGWTKKAKKVARIYDQCLQ